MLSEAFGQVNETGRLAPEWSLSLSVVSIHTNPDAMAPTAGFRMGLIAACVGASAGHAAAQQSITPPPPGRARVVLSTDRPRFFLGENVLVHYCIENTSSTPFQIRHGGDYRGGSRSQRFKMTLTDERGAAVADPDPSGYHEGGSGAAPTIAPQGHWCQSVQLMRYARVDLPGVYTIRVVHDLGWPKGQAPEGRTTLTMVMPTAEEAEQVVSRTLRLPTDDQAGFAERRKPFQDFSTLRYRIYLAPLLRLAAAGDTRALMGLGAIPAPEATRALIDLMAHTDRAVARASVQTLAMRLPDPALDGALGSRNPLVNELHDARRYLRNASWRSEFAPDVRAAARRLLSSPDVQDVVQGAFMIEAAGEKGDAASLSRALTVSLRKTRTLPFQSGFYPRPRGAMQELLRAAETLVARGYTPPARPEQPGDLALWLVAVGRGARPDGWHTRFATILAHPLPYLRELALTRLPADAPARLFRAVGPALRSADIDLKIAACEVVRRAKLVRYRDGVAAIVRTAKASDTQLLSFSSHALYTIGGRVEVLEIMASRLTEPDVSNEAISQLFSVFEGTTGSGGGFAAPDELKTMSARWRAFIAAHRSALEAGQHFSLEDPGVTADLVPRGWKLYRAGKPPWPPGP